MCKVLVTEDEPDIRAGFALVLEVDGHEVVTAAHGGEAMEVLIGRRWRPDVIILDLMMPVMNGLELWEHLRADATLAAIPVVVVSGHHDLLARVGDRPAFAVLRKPFAVTQLLGVIARAGGGAA